MREQESELKAALIRSEHGALVLPMWLENHSQFVPGALTGNSATIVVPGGGDKAVGVFHPLAPALARIHQRLKAEFDPQRVFNRGRMYADL